MKASKLVSYLLVRLGSLFVFVAVLITACEKQDSSNASVASTPNIKLIADNLVSPLSVVEPPDGSKRLFIVDQVGKVWIVGADGVKLPTPFIDLAGKMVNLSAGYDERGLLSMAFHPNFKNNGKFYLFYTALPRTGGPQPGVNWNNLTRISEFKVSAANSNLADLNSERAILEEDHPQSNHNGGTIAFGPDGYLYISIGDGGGSNDNGAGHVPDWYTVNTGGNGQDLYANLLGNVLRIDVDNGNPYSIPADNPFVGTNAKKEIYAYGFRNPYRFSFDMGGAHQLLLGDAGQALYEEIDVVTKGGNYGWNVKEGTACFSTDNNMQTRASCPLTDTAGKPLIDPVIELKNAANPAGGVTVVVVGGNVYRGSELPELQGVYIFGNYSQDGRANGKLYKASPAASGMWAYEDLKLKDFPTDLGMFLKGFGQDLSGEIYLAASGVQGVSGTSGKIYKLFADN
ncbi:MAG: PQQ-dependent sugar dehydrogenase [Williamsia sp.]|nr:PQQ-dependent sugar dehydrogenase [Williamsia sp.]